MADIKVGKITHYYDRIGVAVVELSASLSVGDKIRISSHDSEFTQEVDSMQVEHQEIKEADKGDIVGMKISQAVKEGDEIYKVS